MSKARKLKSFKRLKGIVVLSLFDGMSCGQIALNRIGLNIETYYASEIDKYAMQVTQHNYPDTIQIGNVLDITIERLSKFEILLNGKYIIDTRKLIIIGGSPCQGFSFAGTMVGSSTECNIDVTTLDQYLDLKSKNFKFRGESYLFWEYIRVLHDVKPMYYFLENVKMIKKWKGMFNDAMGHEPVIINSALVSAQTRVRLYWTNIPDVVQPDDKGILLKDIVESGEVDRDKSRAIITSIGRTTEREYFKKHQGQMILDKVCNVNPSGKGMNGNVYGNVYGLYAKSPTLTTNKGEGFKIVCGALRGRYLVEGKRQDHKMLTAGKTEQRLEVRKDFKSNTLTTVQKDNVIV